MRKRSVEILRLLKKGNKKIKISFLTKKYNISERTVKNDIDEINLFLNSINMSYIWFDSDGILQAGKKFDSKIIQHNLDKLTLENYRLSKEERQLFVKIKLLWTDKIITMKELAEELDVTRITIVNDIKVIKEEFDVENIKLDSKAGKGMYVQLSGDRRAEILINQFKNLPIGERNNPVYNRFLLDALNVKFTFNEIFNHVQDYLNKNNIILVEDKLYILVSYLFIEFNREINYNFVANTLDKNNLNNLINYVGNQLKINVNNETKESYIKFLNNNNITDYIKNIDQLELYSTISHFLVEIDKNLNYNLSLDDVLIDSLLMHIKNMRDWGDVSIDMSGIEESIFKYDSLKSVVEDNLYILENYLNYKINDNMKKSIIIHICVSIVRNNILDNKPNVLIVCPGSMATGRYLELQIKKYFDFNIIDVIPIDRLKEKFSDFKDVDFIISSVNLDQITSNYIKVHAVLQIEDLNSIQKMSLKHQYNKLNNQDFEVLRYVDMSQNNKNISKTAIGHLLLKEDIILQEKGMNWRNAIKITAAPLLEKSFIKESYVNKSIENVEIYGDYIVMGYGVAIAHAGKDDGVNVDSLSLMVSKNGITFSDDRNKVNLLFFFASDGKYEYTNLYKEIIRIGQNKEYINYLIGLSKEQLFYELCINNEFSD